jgi:hypothetical protein
VVRSQLGQIVDEILSGKKPITKNRAGGVAQGEGPEFTPQYCKKKKKYVFQNKQIYLCLSFNVLDGGKFWDL